MDRITLKGVRAYGRHGSEPEERERRQPFDVDVTVEIDLRAAGSTDDLTQTMDYSGLQARLVRVVATTSYALIERLATDLLDVVFDDPRVSRAEVTVSKPAILDGATPSVTLARSNPRHPPP